MEGPETELSELEAALLFPVAPGTMGLRLRQDLNASGSKSGWDKQLTQSLLRGNNSHRDIKGSEKPLIERDPRGCAAFPDTFSH